MTALRIKNIPDTPCSGNITITEFHVWLHNPHLSPCTQAHFGQKHEAFTIHVLSPGATEDNPVYRVYGWQGETDALRQKHRLQIVKPRPRATNQRWSSKQTSWPTGDLDMKLIEAILRYLLLDF